MGSVFCEPCGESFEGRSLPWCPVCLAARWLATERLIRDKHDPAAAANRLDTYRSIITPRTRAEIDKVLDHAAREGSWYWDRDYGMWVHVTRQPLGRAPGVGIPAGQDGADHALDCLFIAEADSAEEAHVFAADGQRHEAQIRAGVFIPLGRCDLPDCENLASPGSPRCWTHSS